MSELMSQWVRTIAAAALISGVAMAITPKGKVYRVLKAVCGVLIVIAIIYPLTDENSEEISMSLSEHRASADEILKGVEESNMNLCRSIIEEELEEYILDKAVEMGELVLSADISSKWHEDGYWYPYQVKLLGDCQLANRSKMSLIIESELGIPFERQNWDNYEGD